MKKQTKKGFTLVELVIVIAVIAILSAILIPTFGNVIKDANDTAALDSARTAYQNFLVNNAKDIDYADSDAYILVLEDEVAAGNDITAAKTIYEVKGGALVKATDGYDTVKTNFAGSSSKVTVTATVDSSKTAGHAYKIAEKTYIVFKVAPTSTGEGTGN